MAEKRFEFFQETKRKTKILSSIWLLNSMGLFAQLYKNI